MPRAASLLATLVLALGMAVLAVAPRTARADPSQLCRAGMNIALAPFDVALSPFITAKDMYYGLTEVDDEVWIQILGAPIGYVYLNGVQIGGGVLRLIAGVIEIPAGLFTLFRDGSEPPLFRSQDETWQMYRTDLGPCPVRFGSSYNTINEG